MSTGFVQIFGQFVSKRKEVSLPVGVCLVKCLCLNSLIVSLHVMQYIILFTWLVRHNTAVRHKEIVGKFKIILQKAKPRSHGTTLTYKNSDTQPFKIQWEQSKNIERSTVLAGRKFMQRHVNYPKIRGQSFRIIFLIFRRVYQQAIKRFYFFLITEVNFFNVFFGYV